MPYQKVITTLPYVFKQAVNSANESLKLHVMVCFFAVSVLLKTIKASFSILPRKAMLTLHNDGENHSWEHASCCVTGA